MIPFSARKSSSRVANALTPDSRAVAIWYAWKSFAELAAFIMVVTGIRDEGDCERRVPVDEFLFQRNEEIASLAWHQDLLRGIGNLPGKLSASSSQFSGSTWMLPDKRSSASFHCFFISSVGGQVQPFFLNSSMMFGGSSPLLLDMVSHPFRFTLCEYPIELRCQCQRWLNSSPRDRSLSRT